MESCVSTEGSNRSVVAAEGIPQGPALMPLMLQWPHTQTCIDLANTHYCPHSAFTAYCHVNKSRTVQLGLKQTASLSLFGLQDNLFL